MYGIIYKITNLVNNKVYIGQTKQTLKRRYAHHLSSARHRDNYLYRAMRKYKFENFKIEQIDTAETLEQLDTKECYWIKYYKSSNPKYGYNLREGGHKNSFFTKKAKDTLRKGHVKRKVYCFETHEIFDSIKEAEMKYNCSSYICRACHGKNNIVKGLHWCYLEDKDKPELHIIPENNRIKVYCLEENRVYRSLTEAAKNHGCNYKTISNICEKNKQKQQFIDLIDNCHFCFLDDKELLFKSLQ